MIDNIGGKEYVRFKDLKVFSLGYRVEGSVVGVCYYFFLFFIEWM